MRHITDYIINESITKVDDYYELELFHSSQTLKFDAIFNSNGADFGKGSGAMLGKGLYANLNEKQVMKHHYGKFSFKFELKIPCNKVIIANKKIYNKIYKTDYKTDTEVIKKQFSEYNKIYTHEKSRMNWKSFIAKGFLMMVYYGSFDDESIVLWDYTNKNVNIKCTQWKYAEQDWVNASISMDDFENKFDVIAEKIQSKYKEQTFDASKKNIIDYDINKARKYLKTLTKKEQKLFNKYDKIFDGELYIIPDKFDSKTTLKLQDDGEYIIFGPTYNNWNRSRTSANLTGNCKSLTIVGEINIKGDIHIENLVINLNDDFRVYSNYQTLFKNIDNIIIDNNINIFKSSNVGKFISQIHDIPGTYDNVKTICFLRNPDDNNKHKSLIKYIKLKDKETDKEITVPTKDITPESVKSELLDKFPNAEFFYKTIANSLLPDFIKKWIKTDKSM